MTKRIKGKKLKLQGFNNLTKSLNFNIYDICYAGSTESQLAYLDYIDDEYNSQRLESIVEELTGNIGARLVSVSTQDYDPRGASVVALLNEEQPETGAAAQQPRLIEAPSSVGHLDKSHIAIHTYPEYNQLSGVATFRVDIDISTCGKITPLSALNYLIDSFESEIVIIDYSVRGFTRDLLGNKLFIDHNISSVQEYISKENLNTYMAYDINIISENIFHTKMRKKNIKLRDFLFGDEITSLAAKDKKRVKKELELEIQEIFESKPIGKTIRVKKPESEGK